MEFRGWSKEELKHASTVLEHAEARKHSSVRVAEHLHLWLLVLVLVFVSLAMVTLVFPLVVFGNLIFSIPILFILGACCGLLLVHSLHSLRHKHHMAAFATLVILSLFALTFVIDTIQDKFLIVPGARVNSAFLLAGVFVIGMAVPYITDRRIHGLA